MKAWLRHGSSRPARKCSHPLHGNSKAKPDRGISAATSKEDYWDLLIPIGSGKNIAVTLDLSNLPGKPAAPMCFVTDVLILYMSGLN